MTNLQNADPGMALGGKVRVMVDERVDATAHVKTVAEKIVKDVMVPGPSLVTEPVTEPVKAVAMAAVAHAVVAVAGAVPGGSAEIARCKVRAKVRANASALMQKADPLHWKPLPRRA